MKMRLATPATLVDINGVPGLDTLKRNDGHLRVGALLRHADLARSALTFGAVRSAAPWISDPLVRNRGTLCGSVAHCDPEGDWNTVLLATGAEVMAH
jgi:carbon-monoxide dehydrogenase medium subunit